MQKQPGVGERASLRRPRTLLNLRSHGAITVQCSGLHLTFLSALSSWLRMEAILGTARVAIPTEMENNSCLACSAFCFWPHGGVHRGIPNQSLQHRPGRLVVRLEVGVFYSICYQEYPDS